MKLGGCWTNFTRFDHDFENVRKSYTTKFNEEFASALNMYVMGDWVAASTLLEEIRSDTTFYDPVNEFLRNYIKTNNSKPPDDWKGGRKVLLKK